MLGGESPTLSNVRGKSLVRILLFFVFALDSTLPVGLVDTVATSAALAFRLVGKL